MEKRSKLILAVLQGDDYDNTVSELNKAGFFVTMLSSTGGFLKKRSTTAMIGVEEEKLEEVLGILKRCTGKRVETVYQNLPMAHGGSMSPVPIVPMAKTTGGATVFVMDLDRIEKY